MTETAGAVLDRPAEQHTRCSGFKTFRGLIRSCPVRATTKIAAGCVHEHIHNTWACEGCAQQILAGEMGCAKCIRSSDPHRCILAGRVVETRD